MTTIKTVLCDVVDKTRDTWIVQLTHIAGEMLKRKIFITHVSNLGEHGVMLLSKLLLAVLLMID